MTICPIPYKFLNFPILSSSALGLWPSSVTKTKCEVYCSVLQILSVMALSNLELEEHKSCAARDDKERLDCKKKKATKNLFPLAPFLPPPKDKQCRLNYAMLGRKLCYQTSQ